MLLRVENTARRARECPPPSRFGRTHSDITYSPGVALKSHEHGVLIRPGATTTIFFQLVSGGYTPTLTDFVVPFQLHTFGPSTLWFRAFACSESSSSPSRGSLLTAFSRDMRARRVLAVPFTA
jgi:hypothetical protein